MKQQPRVRVVLADDSTTVRAVLRRILKAADLEVVGEGADGREALELVRERDPDVVVLDLDMPNMDGAEATQRIMAEFPRPVLILTARADPREFKEAARALGAGALDIMAKPQTPAAWSDLGAHLVTLLREAAAGRRGGASKVARYDEAEPPRGWRPTVVAVGSSTGGPGALREFLTGLGPGLPVPVLAVQHIAPGFEKGLAEWLRAKTGVPVRVPETDGGALPGEVLLAPWNRQMRLLPGLRVELDGSAPPRGGHRPSVDELFLSAAEVEGRGAAAVLLTGMGRDGVEGLLAVRKRGGLTIAQEPATCVVAGMPSAAISEGAAGHVLPPGRAGALLRELIAGRGMHE